MGKLSRALRGDDEDHGAPTEVSGKRADRRTTRTQVVRIGMFGGTKVYRGGREGDLRDRFRG